MKRIWLILATTVILAALLIPTPIYVRQDLGWIDSISGSRMSQTEWRFGPSSSPVVAESLLAARYRKLGLQWEMDWCNVEGTYLNFFGRNVGHAHGSAPAIYTLAVSPEFQRAFLASSTDEDIRAFFRVMSGGTESEKRTVVETACDNALEYAATRPF